LCIGNDPIELVRYFKGSIDEVSIYSRALSSAEIQSIYNAMVAGKCPPPPVITSQPTDRTVVQGDSTTFTVAATGQGTLLYHWTFNRTDITDATNATLALTGVQSSQAGTYGVRVSNSGGTVTSSGATLTVLVP